MKWGVPRHCQVQWGAGNFPGRLPWRCCAQTRDCRGPTYRLICKYRGFESFKGKCRSYCFGGVEVRVAVESLGKGVWYRAGN